MKSSKEALYENDKLYDYDNDGTITAYKGDAGHLVIPARFPFKPGSFECGFVAIHSVNSPRMIGESVFENNDKLISVEIPGIIEEIGPNAFRNCKNLKSITLQEGLLFIREYAFFGCESLTSVTIPKSVVGIFIESFGYGYPADKAKDFIIYGAKGSTAEQYAKENGCWFEAIK